MMFKNDFGATFDNYKISVLLNLRRKVIWEIKGERQTFLYQVNFVFSDWEGKLPNLKDIFSIEEIEYLLLESASYKYENQFHNEGKRFIEFVARTGYKDEPKVDADGKPQLRRTTAVHRAAQHLHNYDLIGDLFKIYNRFDLNYIDESGQTHFHAACKFGLKDVVNKFFELGQDPNCLDQETVDSPLHLTLAANALDVAELLLKKGANPNLKNSEGLTPLHFTCKNKMFGDRLVNILFEFSDTNNQPMQIDAKDNLGRTPLQWAVARFLPNIVGMLLDHGADLDSFVFPSASHFDEGYKMWNNKWNDFRLELSSRALMIVEILEKRGYELGQSNALTIMAFINKYGLLEKSEELVKCLCEDENFRENAKTLMIKPNMSLYNLSQLNAKEAAKLITCTDYYNLIYSQEYLNIPYQYQCHCELHLCEKMWKKFFQSWTLDLFWKLTRSYRLPFECCEFIIDELNNRDLFNVCLAATQKPENVFRIVENKKM